MAGKMGTSASEHDWDLERREGIREQGAGWFEWSTEESVSQR